MIKIDSDAVRVCSDGERDGDRNLHVGRQLQVRHTITHSQTGSSPNFSFTQTCGGPGATASGVETPLNVTLTVTDSNGTTTVQSGSGAQPPLTIKFSC